MNFLMRSCFKRDALPIMSLVLIVFSLVVEVVEARELEKWQASELVIVISMDGMRYDYPDLGDFPGLKLMESEGLRVGKMIPTFPSNTFPGHVSLATGTTPEKHGIIDNNFYDKKLKRNFDVSEAVEWLEAEPLWITAVRQGKRSAVYYWVGSEGQWNNKNATYYKSPFRSMRSEQEKVDQIIQWIDMPVSIRPHLIMSYWHGVDSVAHKLGPVHEGVIRQIKKQDKYLQALQKALDERGAWGFVTLILVSDHGMTERGVDIDLAKLFKEGGIEAYVNKSSAIAHVNLKNKRKDKSKERTTKEAYSFFSKHKSFKVYYPKKMPKSISVNHEARSGDLVLVAKDGYRFSSSGFYGAKSKEKIKKSSKKGMHGLPSKHLDMAALVLAQGRGVKAGSTIKTVNMIDVAPSVSRLIGIDAPLQSQGKVFLPNQ